MDNLRQIAGTGEVLLKPSILDDGAASTDEQATRSDAGRQILSAAALAAAAAAIALPLIAVKGAEAELVYCAADGYMGQDVGDPADCADCFYSAIPADCSLSPPSDGDGSCASCSCSCSCGCSSCDDPYGS